MTPTSQQRAESWAIRIQELEALRHRAEGDPELDAELVAMQKMAAIALKNSAEAKEVTP